EDEHVDEPREVVEDLADRPLRRLADAADELPGLAQIELAFERLEVLAEIAHVLGQEGPEDDAPEHVPFVEDGQHEIPQPAEAVAYRDLRLLERPHLDVRDRLGAEPAAGRAGEHVGAEIAGGGLDVDELRSLRVEDLEADLVEIDERLADLGEGRQIEQLPEDELLLQDAFCHDLYAPPAIVPSAAVAPEPPGNSPEPPRIPEPEGAPPAPPCPPDPRGGKMSWILGGSTRHRRTSSMNKVRSSPTLLESR